MLYTVCFFWYSDLRCVSRRLVRVLFANNKLADLIELKSVLIARIVLIGSQGARHCSRLRFELLRALESLDLQTDRLVGGDIWPECHLGVISRARASWVKQNVVVLHHGTFITFIIENMVNSQSKTTRQQPSGFFLKCSLNIC